MQSVLLSMSTRFDIKQSILLFYSFFTRDARFIRASVVNQSCEDVGSVAKRSICSACGKRICMRGPFAGLVSIGPLLGSCPERRNRCFCYV
jgi:hypothetical protein